MKLVSIGLLLLMAYCIAIVRQAMQTSVPSRHSECESLYPHKAKKNEQLSLLVFKNLVPRCARPSNFYR